MGIRHPRVDIPLHVDIMSELISNKITALEFVVIDEPTVEPISKKVPGSMTLGNLKRMVRCRLPYCSDDTTSFEVGNPGKAKNVDLLPYKWPIHRFGFTRVRLRE